MRILFPLIFATTFLVTNTNDTGAGSLRAAIDDVNATCEAPIGDVCRIEFRIPVATAPWATIRPATPLPAIVKNRVIVDGSSQTRFADTNPLGPEIELDGSLLTSGNGITLASPCGAAVHELAINGFPDNGVYVGGPECEERIGGGMRSVVGNYIGTDPTGTRAVPNLRGVFIAPEGEDFFAPAWIAQNVISGNRYSGVWIAFGSQNRVYFNKIGLNATATAALGNGSSGVYVGGAVTGADIIDNYIGFNGHYGLSIDRAAVRVMAATNSFQANGNLAIDHGLDGFTPAIPDLGERPGNFLHAPVVTNAFYDAASDTTVVEGTVDVHTEHGFRGILVMLYANDEPDPSGYGEGQYLLGRADPDSQGRFRFVYQGRTPGRWIAALSASSQVWGFVRVDGGAGGYSTTSSEFSRTVEVTQ